MAFNADPGKDNQIKPDCRGLSRLLIAPSWLDAVGSPTLALVAPAALPAWPTGFHSEVEKLERSWQRLDRELRPDALIPPEPEPIPNRFEPAPPLPHPTEAQWLHGPWLQMQTAPYPSRYQMPNSSKPEPSNR